MKYFCIIILLCTAILICGCNNSVYLGETYYDVLGTVLNIGVFGKSTQTIKEDIDAVAEELRRIESIISSNALRYPNSDIVLFNELASGERVAIDSVTADIISTAQDMYKRTEGAYDPTVYHLIEHWGFGNYGGEFDTDNPQLQTQRIEALLGTVGFDRVELVKEKGESYLVKKGKAVLYDGKLYETAIDLGGIGKGYATDIAAQMLRDMGYTKGYVSLGGSSIVALENAQNGDGMWQIDIVNPRSDKTKSVYYATFKTKNLAVGSSGDYQRYEVYGGKRYCHIINPFTGYPVEGEVIMATVTADSGAVTDALSTALIVTGDADIVKRFKGVKYVTVSESDGYKVDGTLNVTIINDAFVKV